MAKFRLMMVILVGVLLTVTIAPVTLNADTHQQQVHLSESGPWLLYLATTPGDTFPYLWGINADGTGLSQLSEQPVLRFAVNPNPQPNTGSRLVAYIGTAVEGLHQDLSLYLLSLPDGAISDPIPLTSEETGFLPDEDIWATTPGASKLDIAAGLALTQNLVWSPDGQWLAFTGAMDGPSLDLYSYQLSDGTVRRLTDGPSQAYQLWWTADSRQIIHSATLCFACAGGSYEGGQGVWGAAPDGSGLVTYEGPAPARFVAWKDSTHLLMDSGERNGEMGEARVLDIAANHIEPLDLGSFGPIVYDDAGSHALLYMWGGSTLMQEGEGLYLVDLDAGEATFIEDLFATIWWERYGGRFLIAGDVGTIAVSTDGTVTEAATPSQALSPDGRFSAWFDSVLWGQWAGSLRLQTGDGEPEPVLDGGGVALEWSPDSQSFYYDTGQPGLYLVVAETMKVLPLFNEPGLPQEWPYSALKMQAVWVPG